MSSGLAAAFRSKRFEHSPIICPGFRGDPVEKYVSRDLLDKKPQFRAGKKVRT